LRLVWRPLLGVRSVLRHAQRSATWVVVLCCCHVHRSPLPSLFDMVDEWEIPLRSRDMRVKSVTDLTGDGGCAGSGGPHIGYKDRCEGAAKPRSFRSGKGRRWWKYGKALTYLIHCCRAILQLLKSSDGREKELDDCRALPDGDLRESHVTSEYRTHAQRMFRMFHACSRLPTLILYCLPIRTWETPGCDVILQSPAQTPITQERVCH